MCCIPIGLKARTLNLGRASLLAEERGGHYDEELPYKVNVSKLH